ncbi:teichoic acid transport system permease protein [Promicromonospora sp. AC04]|uniref:ABC transporter permease n=1 Tax=Promicromonospora sp. AC04 TaxID=2135723 RepID=UPI000D3796EE|nr:ABC transporter permease [Promicromonospora sp. AC04]PUB20148.1 teichoic acid transport system permease protein [Promicromonospora sp. AC04]
MSTPTTDAAAPAKPAASGDAKKPPPPLVPSTTSAERLALAQQHGLRPLNVRPPLGEYIRSLASRWAFIRVLATSTAYAKNQNNYLGQLWAVLNPILNAAVYVLIFGVLLHLSRGVSNSIAYIVIGVFMFRFVEASVSGGAKSISGKTQLLRSLHFPRAVLPMSTVLSLLTTLVPAIVVMCGITLLSGYIPTYTMVHVTWWWLLLPAAVALMWIFNTGLAFIMARMVASVPDLDNIIGFVMRVLMYASGVIFPVSHYVENLGVSETAKTILTGVLDYQPIAVYLYLVRSVLMQEDAFPPSGLMWALGGVWAVVFFVIGFIVFWRGEERYGRD